MKGNIDFVLRRLARSGISDQAVSVVELLNVLKTVPLDATPNRPASDVLKGLGQRLGHSGLESDASVMKSSREIFANNEVHLDKIKTYGFDFDYTLASYTTHLQKFIYRTARDYLVEVKQYPKGLIYETEYDKTFAIRGLTFDKERGLLFKLGPNFKVDLSCVFRGRKRLEEDEALEAFGNVPHVDRRTSALASLVGIYDQFSLAEACLLADVCEYFISRDISFSSAAVYQDISDSIGYVHISRIMHKAVMNDVVKYLHKGPKLRRLLEEMQESNVNTFILSNSSFDYVDAGMRYICGEDWMELFSVIVTDADKPSFYSGRNPFRQVDVNSASPNEPRRLKWSEVTEIRPMQVYSKGNVTDLMKMTGWKGTEVIYFGDHVAADLRTPARQHGWITAAIIRELEKETVVERTEEYQLMNFKMQVIEEIMRRIQWAPPGHDRVTLLSRLDQLEQDRFVLRQSMNDMMNCNFGSAFVCASGPSLFSSYMERYVDLYTSRLENFLDYGLDYRFYPRRRKRLPHEPRPKAVTPLIAHALNRNIDKRDVSLKPELSFSSKERESER